MTEWIENLNEYLNDQLDWYFSHHPEILGSETSIKHTKYTPNEEMKKATLASSYKWESDATDYCIRITLNVKDKTHLQMKRLLDEMSLLLEERAELLNKKKYILFIQDDSNRNIDLKNCNVYNNITLKKDEDACTKDGVNEILSHFIDFINLCEEKKIAFKVFYEIYSKDDMKELTMQRQMYVNSWWIN